MNKNKNNNYKVADPEFVGIMPTREDITVYQGDKNQKPLGWVVKESIGGGVIMNRDHRLPANYIYHFDNGFKPLTGKEFDRSTFEKTFDLFINTKDPFDMAALAIELRKFKETYTDETLDRINLLVGNKFVSYYYNLSVNYIKNNLSKLDIYCLTKNENLSEEAKEFISNYSDLV
jgi:hypothetical protein